MSEIRDFNKMVLSEVLQAINDEPSLMDKGQPFAFQPHSALAIVFAHAYIPAAKFKLPDGDPPYNKEERKPGMTSSDLHIAFRRNRFSYYVDSTIDQRKREQLFIMLIETVCNDEAKVLLAIKDQKLDLLYPNLTYDLLEQYGYLPTRSEQEKAEAKSKSDMDEKDEVPAESKPVDTPSKTRSKASAKRGASTRTTKRTTARKTKENVADTQ